MKMAQLKKYIFWKPNSQKKIRISGTMKLLLNLGRAAPLDLSIKVPPPPPTPQLQSPKRGHDGSKSKLFPHS